MNLKKKLSNLVFGDIKQDLNEASSIILQKAKQKLTPEELAAGCTACYVIPHNIHPATAYVLIFDAKNNFVRQAHIERGTPEKPENVNSISLVDLLLSLINL